MKRRNLTTDAGDDSNDKHLAPLESNLFAKLFNLIEHCAVIRYEDGTPRKTGWITVQTQGAGWTVVVKDPDACAQLRCHGASLDDALVLADLLLGAEKAPWELDPFLAEKSSKKKK